MMEEDEGEAVMHKHSSYNNTLSRVAFLEQYRGMFLTVFINN